MSRKTHSHKRNHRKRSPKLKPSRVPTRNHGWRAKILAGAVAFALLAGGTFAHWRAKRDEVLVAENIPSPVKNISTASQRDLADIPPEALHPQPPMIDAGYKAHSGGLPPGALPPGVVLPGMPMMPGVRTTAQGYGMYDGIRQQFTGKERDNETGLDYFGARYYSPTQGRFTSVDPENAGADPSDPQTWNGYAYARNNPLKYTDPDGRKFRICGTDGACTEGSYDLSDADFYQYFRDAKGIKVKGGNIYQNGELIGTYQRLSDDNWNDWQNQLVFGEIPRRTAPIPKAVLAFEGVSVAGGVLASVLVPAGSGLTTLGLGAEAAGGTSAATGTTVTVAGRAINAIGNGLKNVRQMGSGRLGGYLRGNTELPGGDQAARETFRQLAGRDPAGAFDRVVQGGKEIVYRATSSSG